MKITYNAIQDAKDNESAIICLRTNLLCHIQKAVDEIYPCPVCHSNNIAVEDKYSSHTNFDEHYLVGTCHQCKSTFESNPYLAIAVFGSYDNGERYDQDKQKFVLDEEGLKAKRIASIFLILPILLTLVAIASGYSLYKFQLVNTSSALEVILTVILVTSIVFAIISLFIGILSLCEYLDYYLWCIKRDNEYLKENKSKIPLIISGIPTSDSIIKSKNQLNWGNRIPTSFINEALCRAKKSSDKE